jgi:UDP-3-O-[3-hydroxymyristoyl] glucosamine N-acyltransferase
MKLTLAEIAALVDGELIGDGAVLIRGVAALKEATPDDISFLTGSRYTAYLASTRAAAVIVPLTVEHHEKPIIRVVAPDQALVRVLSFFHPAQPPVPEGAHPTAQISGSATLGSHVGLGPFTTVGAHTVIEDGARLGAGVCVGAYCRVGKNTWLYPRVALYDRVILGHSVIVHSGAIIGSDGFGYARAETGAVKIPQTGGVIIEDEVEIGANTTIDRATLGHTRIGRGSKIDNLVQIGHNVRIGAHVTICAQVGVAGSSVIEDGALIAGQAGIGDHIHIGAGARIGGQAGVTKSIPAGCTVSGYPARPHRQSRRIEAAISRLPAMMNLVRKLERRIEQLENPSSGTATDYRPPGDGLQT